MAQAASSIPPTQTSLPLAQHEAEIRRIAADCTSYSELARRLQNGPLELSIFESDPCEIDTERQGVKLKEVDGRSETIYIEYFTEGGEPVSL
jgi:hypothetical protein